MPLARKFGNETRVLFQITDSNFNENYGALEQYIIINQANMNCDSSYWSWLYEKNIFYIYLLNNGNFLIEFTSNNILMETNKNLHQNFYKIDRVIGIFALKKCSSHNPLFFKFKIQHSVSKLLGLSFQTFSELGNEGFKCDVSELLSCIMSLDELINYDSLPPLQLRWINHFLKLNNLIIFKK